MEKVKQQVPSLRFSGFTGDWRKRALGDGCEILMCKRIFADQTAESGDVPFYKIGTLGGKPDSYISRELFEEYRERYNYPKAGETLITCAGTVGKCVQFDGQDSYYQDSNIVWIDNPEDHAVNDFLFLLLTRIDWSKLNSTTITRIYGNDLRAFELVVAPTLPEQQKIAAFLGAVDRKIQQLKRKQVLLERYKQAVMQQLLDQKLRFPGFTGDYKEYRLAQLLERYSENNKDGEFGINDILSLSSRFGIVDRKELLQDTYDNVNHLNYVKTRMNDFVYAKSISTTAPFGSFKANLCRDGLLSTLYFTFKVKELADPRFLEYYFSDTTRANNYLRKVVLVGDRYITADSDYLLSGTVRIPSLPEQKKITSFLMALDAKVAGVAQAVAAAQQWKKGLLQQMFV